MTDFRWPGDSFPAGPGGSPLETLGKVLAAAMRKRETHYAPHSVPAPDGGYDPADHAPYAHTTGQSVFDTQPDSMDEERLRLHISAFVFDFLDTALPEEQREQAMRHALVCDPVRTVGMISTMLMETWAIAELTEGLPEGMHITELRKLLDRANARFHGTTDDKDLL